jgi:hypothetical protein
VWGTRHRWQGQIFLAAFREVRGTKGRPPSRLAHQAQVGIAAEVGEVRKNLADLAVGKTHPLA